MSRGAVVPVLLAIAVRAAIVGTAWLVSPSASTFTLSDSPTYLVLGHSLATRHVFALAAAPELLRLPGYPLLIAIGDGLGHPTAITLGVQIWLGGLTAWLCYLTARGIAGE